MNAEASAQALSPQDGAQLLFSLLTPDMIGEAEKIGSGQADLVHYTTAENLISILRTKRFWLRSVRTMNDFMEVEHGIAMLMKAFGGPDNNRVERICSCLDTVCPGAARAGIDLFNLWLPRLTDITFIGCLSQAPPSEIHGRLSMWRAYSSPTAGVAIVMNNTPFMAETNELKAYSLPVAYFTEDAFLEGVDRCIAGIEASVGVFGSVDHDAVVATIFWWLLALSVSLKHPGFHEEKEWRVIYFPEIDRSPAIEQSVENVRGVPQIVQKIPLIDNPSLGLHGAAPVSLIKKVIIGPTEYPLVIRDALIHELELAGVNEASSLVSISNIPLR